MGSNLTPMGVYSVLRKQLTNAKMDMWEILHCVFITA